MGEPDYLPVTVRFHRGRGLGSAIVRWWTNSSIGHVDLVIGHRVLDVRPSTGVTWSSTEEIPGLGVVDSVTFWRTPTQIAAADQVISRWIGARYDWWGAIAAGMPWFARQHADRGFCSEMVADWLDAADALNVWESWRLQPVSILNLLRPQRK